MTTHVLLRFAAVLSVAFCSPALILADPVEDYKETLRSGVQHHLVVDLQSRSVYYWSVPNESKLLTDLRAARSAAHGTNTLSRMALPIRAETGASAMVYVADVNKSLFSIDVSGKTLGEPAPTGAELLKALIDQALAGGAIADLPLKEVGAGLNEAKSSNNTLATSFTAILTANNASNVTDSLATFGAHAQEHIDVSARNVKELNELLSRRNFPATVDAPKVVSGNNKYQESLILLRSLASTLESVSDTVPNASFYHGLGKTLNVMLTSVDDRVSAAKKANDGASKAIIAFRDKPDEVFFSQYTVQMKEALELDKPVGRISVTFKKIKEVEPPAPFDFTIREVSDGLQLRALATPLAFVNVMSDQISLTPNPDTTITPSVSGKTTELASSVGLALEVKFNNRPFGLALGVTHPWRELKGAGLADASPFVGLTYSTSRFTLLLGHSWSRATRLASTAPFEAGGNPKLRHEQFGTLMFGISVSVK
jgi:hypothetical protein